MVLLTMQPLQGVKRLSLKYEVALAGIRCNDVHDIFFQLGEEIGLPL